MPFKKLSRRTFLTASSALAFLHTPFARALPDQQSVLIHVKYEKNREDIGLFGIWRD